MSGTVIAESSVTQKYQATIPLLVREQLGIRAGDKIVFERQTDEIIIIRKKSPSAVDWDYLQAIEGTLSEWNSPEDEAAYGDL
ncbi:AbrB/MazE/SpoVT family DNA-binding domain-containing protein [Synechococcales cyanobacterium C]|uniref:AbrB/MazE/SpoVT family DNA-binding domain-containing protein n=2 Tax=Petrachloros TaxID=2918834 RepID=A0A8K2A7D6_9CYAN|nr:AbrB/MazE/SpoVT family DNA-binding domain-containing protein [Petrachloros mirabilis ULC683]